MKVIILAGGFGTRLGEAGGIMPKPMVKIGGQPILCHIMSHYASYGHKDFFAALGYKATLIKEYFLNYSFLHSDFTVDLSGGKVVKHQPCKNDWRVTLVDTGLSTSTGGRVKRLESYIGTETFMLTYGDGVSDIDLSKLESFHRSHGKMVTVTAVHPGARFGELEIDNDQVLSFQEKPQVGQGWINGGFFIIEPEFFSLIEGDQTMLEQEPLEKAAQMGELMAYRHEGFWQPMDTKRDRDYLEGLWEQGKGPLKS